MEKELARRKIIRLQGYDYSQNGAYFITICVQDKHEILGKIVQGFKSVTTRMCFPLGYKNIWQRSYHDHIIRNEAEYQKIW